MRRRDERGAIAVMMPAILALVVAIGMFAVDLGMQRVVRRDLQSFSDVVALDLGRQLDGTTKAGALLGSAGFADAVRATVGRNYGSVLGEAPRLRIDVGTASATGFTSYGYVTYTAGAASVSSASQVVASAPGAVRVTASGKVGFAFYHGAGGATQSSISSPTSGACYKVGSWAAALKTGNSVLLNPLLRQLAQQSGKFSNGAQVAAIDYTGLAAATVDLNRLAAQLGVGSVSQLATATVSLKAFYAALSALASPADATTVNALNTLYLDANAGTTVQVGKLLGANSGAGSLLGSTANVLDLVGGSIALLNGTNVANVYLGATLPSLTSAGLAVTLIQGPHQYCGSPGDGTTIGVASDTQQITARLGGNLNPTTVDFLPPVISGLLTSVASAQITAQNYVTFDLGVAGTQASLTSILCGTQKGVRLSVKNGLATVTIATPLRATVEGSLLGIASASIAIDATVKVVVTVSPSGVVDYSILVPPQEFDTPYPTASGGLSVAPATINAGANVTANVKVLGGALGAYIALSSNQQSQILTTVVNAGLGALLSPTDPHSLATTVIDPLLGLIGAEVGGSDVILDGVPAPTCSSPKLVG